MLHRTSKFSSRHKSQPLPEAVPDVAEHDARPLLALDVDGVLIPYHPPMHDSAYTIVPGISRKWPVHRDLRTWLSHLPLYYEPVWVTSWGHEACALQAPMGLPENMPVVNLDTGQGDGRRWFKFLAVQTLDPARRIAWLDDDMTPTAERWAAARSVPAITIRPDKRIGITEAHVDLLLDWATSALRTPVD